MKRVACAHRNVGTGKSSVVRALVASGYKAVDTDDGWCEPLPDGRQQWREDAIAALLATEDAAILFVAGCEENQVQFHSQFDQIILLTAPADVLLEREPLLRRAADHEVRTTRPLSDVVAAVLSLVGERPTQPSAV